MSNPFTKEMFVDKSNSHHSGKYDYSLFEYTNMRSISTIICPVHGEFTQCAEAHSNGSGCVRCVRMSTLDDFLEKASAVHSDTYDYRLVDVSNGFGKVKIICRIHGIFTQSINNHISKKQGCPKCGIELNAKNRSFTKEMFVDKSNSHHSGKYDYSLFEYTNMRSISTIICPVHGEFTQCAEAHSNGSGCVPCSRVQYTVSQPESTWLDECNVELQYRQYRITFSDGTYVIADGYDPDTNTVFEFNGDFWHGNPKLYSPHTMHPIAKLTFGKLYENTLTKKQQYVDHGYNVIDIWESDYKLHLKEK